MDDYLERFRRFLEARQLRLTVERNKIARATLRFPVTFTAHDLIDAMRRDTGWGPSRATVYRNVQLLLEAGLIEDISDTGSLDSEFRVPDQFR